MGLLSVLPVLLLIMGTLLQSANGDQCTGCSKRCSKPGSGTNTDFIYGRADPPSKIDEKKFCRNCLKFCSDIWGFGPKRNPKRPIWAWRADNMNPNYFESGRSVVEPLVY